MLLKWCIMCSAACWFISCTVSIFWKWVVKKIQFLLQTSPHLPFLPGFSIFPNFVMQGNWTLNGGFNGISVQMTEVGFGTFFHPLSI
jgi:hypothetical protein